MKVEVLHVAGCPALPQALSVVLQALAREGVAAEVQKVAVNDHRMANELRFFASPTIRIDGRDLDDTLDASQPPALSCRLCAGPAVTAVPSLEMVRQAIAQARDEGDS